MSGFYKIEIPLAFNQSITFGDLYHASGEGEESVDDRQWDCRQSAELKIPVTPKLLEQLTTCGISNLLDDQRNTELPAIVIGRNTAVSGEVRMCIVAGHVSNSLKEWLGLQRTTENKFSLLLDFGAVIDDSSGCILIPEHSTSEVSLLANSRSVGRDLHLGPDSNFSIADAKMEECWTDASGQWKTTVSLTLLVTRKGGAALDLNRKMLTEGYFCDVTLIAKNGTRVKFHKSILTAHSSVFANMFKSGMKESRFGIVQMPGMSKETLLAFRKYLYLWNSSSAAKRPIVGFELLKAGHQYGIEAMSTCMEVILLRKNCYWYTVDVAWQLFHWAKVAEREELKRKAVNVLKWRITELVQLPAYLQCFEEDRSAVNELVMCIAKV